MSFQPLPSRQPVASSHATDAHSPRVLAATALDTPRRPILVLLALFFAAGMVAILATRASGQAPFDSIPMHPALKDEAAVKQVQTGTKTFVTTGKGSPNSARGYFEYYIPAQMTAPDGIKNISALVQETDTYLARAHRSNRPGIARQLTKIVFDGMKKVAIGNYHPSARISATSVLSRLNTSPANNQTNTPALPFAEAYPVLRDLYRDENNVDGLRAAALQGLHRQVLYGFKQFQRASQQEKQGVVADMVALLESDPPPRRSAVAHAYLQRFAVDILDVLRAKDDSSLGVKLINISTEPAKPNLIALYSASRIGAMGNELKGKVARPEQVLASWSTRALDAFEGELARLTALERPIAAKEQPRKPEDFLEQPVERRRRVAGRSMMGDMDDFEDMDDMEDMDEMGMEDYDMEDMDDMEDMEDMMGMMGGMGGMRAAPEKPQPPEVRASRRKLNHVLQQLHLGVTGVPAAGIPTKTIGGLLASVSDDEKEVEVVKAWVTAIEPVVTGLNDKLLDDREKYLDGLKTQVEALRELVGEKEEAALPDDLAELADQGAPAAADELAPDPAPAADSLAPTPVDVVSP